MEAADLVTEMREIKRYYEKGVQARRRIESSICGPVTPRAPAPRQPPRKRPCFCCPGPPPAQGGPGRVGSAESDGGDTVSRRLKAYVQDRKGMA